MSAASEILGPVLAVIASGGVAWITSALANRRNRRQNALRADGEAMDRAMRINKDTVDGLRSEITRLQTELNELRRVLRESQTRSEALERHIGALERTVHRMRVLLQTHGIPVPEGT